MEGSVLHDRKAAGPARGRRMLLDDVPNPSVRRHVLARQVIERECLADSLPQLVGDELELRQQPLTYGRILERLLEATIPALPLLPYRLERDHGRGMLLGAATTRPKGDELRDDQVAELVAGPGERKRDMRVQALEASGAWERAADSTGVLRSQRPLLLVGAFETERERGIVASGPRPPLDAARGLDSRYLRDEVRTCQPKGRRKRRSRVVEGRLLGYGRLAEGAPDRDAAECARLATQLPRDDLTVACHRREAYVARSTPRSP